MTKEQLKTLFKNSPNAFWKHVMDSPELAPELMDAIQELDTELNGEEIDDLSVNHLDFADLEDIRKKSQYWLN